MGKCFVKSAQVIKLLKAGKEIFAECHKNYSSSFNVIYQSLQFRIEISKGNSARIHHSTINSLIKKDIIDAKYNLIATP